jgi:hypothetical protein
MPKNIYLAGPSKEGTSRSPICCGIPFGQMCSPMSNTLTMLNFGFVNGIESDVSQNVTQTFSTLIYLAMALILTPSATLTHFCKSHNCDISKVTLDSDLICQKLTLTIILDENPVSANQISEFIQSV